MKAIKVFCCTKMSDCQTPEQCLGKNCRLRAEALPKPITFEEWEEAITAAGRNPGSGDYSYEEMRASWTAAILEAERIVLAYAQRHQDMRRAALEVAAEQLRRLRSPKVCECCGQARSPPHPRSFGRIR